MWREAALVEVRPEEVPRLVDTRVTERAGMRVGEGGHEGEGGVAGGGEGEGESEREGLG